MTLLIEMWLTSVSVMFLFSNVFSSSPRLMSEMSYKLENIKFDYSFIYIELEQLHDQLITKMKNNFELENFISLLSQPIKSNLKKRKNGHKSFNIFIQK
jgi:hypothetical protein